MDGLIFLIILLPVIFLFLLIAIISNTSDQKRKLEVLNNKLDSLSDQVSSLSNQLRGQKPKEETKQTVTETIRPVSFPVERKEEAPVLKEEIKPSKPVSPPAYQKKVVEHIVDHTDPRMSNTDSRRGTDIEKFIGENLANKIGIAVLVLGIAFFIKYAIDKNWINEAGRVIIGLIAGTVLIGLAHYFRNTYRSFSSVLVGGGLSVFYFSVAFAFHQYHLIGQTAAFVFMVIISGFGVVLSIFYNRQELAILATIGAFITPFLVSTGQENYMALFTYLGIINSGLMVLSWFKRWPAINIIALIFTTIIYSGWLINRIILEDPKLLPYSHAFLFATIFYILFIAMNIMNTIRLKSKFSAFDFIILLSTNFLYYAAGMIILSYWSPDSQGIFTGLLGTFNLVLAVLFFKRKSTDQNFISLLMGLGISFLSLVAPIEFRGNHISLFWSVEMVLLLWLSQKTNIRLLRLASAIIVVLLLGSLVNNWILVYFDNYKPLPIIFNKGFITNIVASISLFIYYKLLAKEKVDSGKTVAEHKARKTVLILMICLAYLTGLLEIWYQFDIRYSDLPVYAIYLQAYSFAITLVLLFIFRKDPVYPALKFILTAFCFAIYIFSSGVNHEVSLALSSSGKSALFSIHWVAALILLWLLYDMIRFFFQKRNELWWSYRSAFTWIAATGIITVLSIELYHVMLWSTYKDPEEWKWWENLYYKAGLTILWGCCSFAMMWLGMKRNFQPLRIISLTLFTVAIIKLFTYDIRNIPPGGKIAAFILLGVLLLAVSFMYQRLKKIIIDDQNQ